MNRFPTSPPALKRVEREGGDRSSSPGSLLVIFESLGL